MNPIQKLIGEAEDFSEYEDLLALDAEQEKTLFNRTPPGTARELYVDSVNQGYKRMSPAEEKIIATDPTTAYLYAAHVLHKPWPEAESVIAKSAPDAMLYAHYVLNDGGLLPPTKRFLEAEPLIAANADAASQYAIHILDRPWPEAEDVIKRDSVAWENYTNHFKIK